MALLCALFALGKKMGYLNVLFSVMLSSVSAYVLWSDACALLTSKGRVAQDLLVNCKNRISISVSTICDFSTLSEKILFSSL